MKTEKDLKVLDVWESPNGNLFLKINSEFSIPLGHKDLIGVITSDMNNDKSLIKASSIVPVKRVGKVILK